jgi:hypothetical protein
MSINSFSQRVSEAAVSDKPIKVLRVTLSLDYMIPPYLGSDVEDLFNEWFINHNPNSYHATRDSCLIVSTRKIVSHSILNLEDLGKEIEDKHIGLVCDNAFPY